MAICTLCNKNINFMGGYVINGLSGKVCEECRSNLLKLRSSNDDAAKKYLRNILQASSDTTVTNFLLNEIEPSNLSDHELTEAERIAALNKKKAEINAIRLSTTDSITDCHIESYGNVVTGIATLGTGFFSELASNISDILGTASTALESKISEAKNNALYSLRKEANSLNCDAVIGVTINFVPFTGNMIGIVATGTAVRLISNTKM